MEKDSLPNIKFFFKRNYNVLVFIYFFILLISTHKPTLEAFEYGAIRKIFNPNLKGSLTYDPQFHFNYIFYFIASFFENYSYNNKINITTYIFWFYDRYLTLILFFYLSKTLFKNENYQLFALILSTVFILNDSMQVDQKSFLFPFFLLSLISIFKKKYALSGFFTGLIFYIHVGWGFWWLIPSSFALFISIFFINYYKIIYFYKYILSALFFSLPIIIYYLNLNLKTSEFILNYEYYSHYAFSSAYYFFKLNMEPWTYSRMFFFFIIPFLCIFKFSEYSNKIKEFILILFGIFFSFFICLIFSDLIRMEQAVRIFLMRSVDVYYFFHLFFIAFIIFYYLKKQNPIYLFVFIFCYVSLNYSSIFSFIFKFNTNIHSLNNQKILINLFYIFLIISESILFLFKYLNIKIIKNKSYLKNLFDISTSNLFVLIFLLLITLTINKNIKFYIKQIVSYQTKFVEINHKQKAMNYINSNIIDSDSIFIIPFYDIDMEYYLDKRVFLTEFSIHDIRYNNKNISDIEKIIKKEFNLSIDDIFFNNNIFDPKKVHKTWLNLWINLDIKTIKKIRNKYQTTHILREVNLPLDLQIIYQNAKYVIYDLQNLK